MSSKNSILSDLPIIIPAVLLLSFGILVIYSSSSQLGFLQAGFAILGLFIYWILSTVNFESVTNYNKTLYFILVLLLLVIFILGVETRGSVRWISLGPINIQPSEFAKPVIILFLASFWARHIPTWRNITISLAWVLPIFLLIFIQPDLGTSLTLGAIWGMMLLGANISIIKVLVMGVFAGILMPVVWLFLKDYQKLRIHSFLSPGNDPLGVGYNVIQATIAVGSGEIFGRGLGQGTQSRLQFLPEFRTDFIFASIAEEFGFLGSAIVLTLYGILIFKCLQILSRSRSRFGGLVLFGFLGMFLFQIIVNVGMNIGIMPVTGITLPLLSYGGSSLFATLVCLSFVSSVSRFTSKTKMYLGD
ncbi:MAG: rod shape-determining protein RodA [Candidatus Daviesbacteria bacterium]|nr:rod shape-determining protein RodA [Candidatus Daviesbacteria bacterium]